MKQKEYEDNIKRLGLKLELLNIVVGRKTNVPFSTGVYFQDGKWILYDVDETQNFTIFKEGDEDTIFKWLYSITLGMAEQENMIKRGTE